MKISMNVKPTELAKAPEFNGEPIPINDLLYWGTENNCSDIMVRVGERPYAMRYGQIVALNVEPINSIDWDEWADYAINSEKNAEYVRNKMFDFAYTYKGYRYRINVGYSRDANCLVARMINPIPPKFVEFGGKINYPSGAKSAIEYALSNGKGGMIIFSAPTGNGKTTTLGSCINSWEGYNNPLNNSHIITLEDPIEYLYDSKESTRIVQKELGKDFLSFELGIKSAMREHPTHILIGELRDKATITAAIEAGRSGHTLMSTFHCRDIASTISRLLDNFSDSLANAKDLVSNISLIVCQRLKPKANKSGYILEVEYMAFDYDIKNRVCDAISKGDNIEFVINDYLNSNSNNVNICGKESL